jgi:hypothetical protein
MRNRLLGLSNAAPEWQAGSMWRLAAIEWRAVHSRGLLDGLESQLS